MSDPQIKTDALIDASAMLTPAVRHKNDGWSNLIKGTGVSGKDPRTSGTFATDVIIPKETLNSLYVNDRLVQKIIDLPAEDAFRQWGTVQNDDTKDFDEGVVTREFNRLDAPTAFMTAKKWSRLTGGALLYIGATGAGAPYEELKVERIQNIEFLKVFDLGDIQTWDCKFDTDLSSPTFGKILSYSVKVRAGTQVQTAYLHASRCIAFPGVGLPASYATTSTLEIRTWGVSILQSMWADLRDFRIAFANTSGILGEFLISKYKFEDLDELLSAGNEKKLQTRIFAIEQSKSLINAVLLGTNEDYVRDSASVAGIEELLDRFMMLVSAGAGIPVTRLFGRSASGLNATGEGDMKQYFDVIAAEQNRLTPDIQRLVTMIASWKGLPEGGDYSWKWNNLFQLSAQQEAEQERLEAETFRAEAEGYRTYMQEGVLQPEDVYKLKFETALGKKPSSYFEEPEPDQEENIDAGNAEVSSENGEKKLQPGAKKSQQE